MSAVNKYAIMAAGLMAIAFALPAQAQLQLGNEVSMKASGNVSFGYTADYSNLTGSDHTLTPSGNGDLSGYYYAPGFVSFDVQPFYNESRANSSYQSIFQSSGVNGTASIFSGSHFPGTVSYSKIYNSEGGLSIPGIGTLTTKGNSDNLALGWGIHVPDYPSVSFQFLDGNTDSTVFGTTQPSTFNAKTFGTQVTDTLAGFNLSAGYQYNKLHTLTPEFLSGQQEPTTSDSSGNSFNFGVGHKLPLRGSFSSSFSRSEFNSEDSVAGDSSNGTIDTVNAGVGFEPTRNLELGSNAQYTNNLTGMLYQSYIAAGVVLPSSLLDYSTHSLDVNSHASYTLPSLHISLMGNADHRQQTVLGTDLSSDTFNEMITYGNDFLGGYINATSGVTQTTVNVNTGASSLGLFDNASYQRNVKQWNLTGSFNYTRNTQTMFIGYTTSGYGYSSGLGRKINAYTYWSANAVMSKSMFNNVAGSGNNSQSYSTSLTLKRMSFSGSYGKADGTSILTATGLVPVSSTPIIPALPAVFFNGHSYSFSASATPMRGLVLSATYAKSRSDTTSDSAYSSNSNAQLTTMLQYKVRQLWIQGGYLKLQQGFSITGQPYASYSSFYMGITRWFNFF